MKDFRNVEKEYRLILRWSNGGGDDEGNTFPYHFYLESTLDSSKVMEIVDQEAIDFISKKTVNAFRGKSNLHVYDDYVELFHILGIDPLPKLRDLINMSISQFARETKLSRQTISDVVRDITEYRNTNVTVARAIANALAMTIDQLYDKLYFSNIKNLSD